MVPADKPGSRSPLPTVAVRPDDIEDVVAALMVSFATDPIARWLCNWSMPAYLRDFPLIMRALSRDCLNAGTVDCAADGSGVALWLPPNAPTDDDELTRVLNKAVPKELQADASALFEWVGELAPKEPHWYLSLVGVDPLAQGRGIGAALIEERLRHVDRDRTRAYLWSSNPRNLSLYRRFGFEVVTTAQFGSSPVITPMLRPAR